MSIAIASVSPGFAFAAADTRWTSNPSGRDYQLHDIGGKVLRLPNGWAASISLEDWPVSDWFVVKAQAGQLKGSHLDHAGNVLARGGVQWFDYGPPEKAPASVDPELSAAFRGAHTAEARLRVAAESILRMAELTDRVSPTIDLGAILVGPEGPAFAAWCGPAEQVAADPAGLLERLRRESQPTAPAGAAGLSAEGRRRVDTLRDADGQLKSAVSDGSGRALTDMFDKTGDDAGDVDYETGGSVSVQDRTGHASTVYFADVPGFELEIYSFDVATDTDNGGTVTMGWRRKGTTHASPGTFKLRFAGETTGEISAGSATVNEITTYFIYYDTDGTIGYTTDKEAAQAADRAIVGEHISAIDQSSGGGGAGSESTDDGRNII